jgi:hypothetical protein
MSLGLTVFANRSLMYSTEAFIRNIQYSPQLQFDDGFDSTKQATTRQRKGVSMAVRIVIDAQLSNKIISARSAINTSHRFFAYQVSFGTRSTSIYSAVYRSSLATTCLNRKV